MNTIFFILFGALALFAGFLLFALFWRSQGKKDDSAMVLLSQQMHELSKTMDVKMSESSKIIREITQELVRVGEGQKQVMSITDQLKNLQDILKNPKQRGVLGEYYLETLLKNVLPPGSYQMQYSFPDGTIVDAAVFVKDKIIPIDSKFSLENYNRLTEAKDAVERERLEKLFVNDLKNRITETSKYIQPEQGTTDFAFMFIPHEAIYYDLLINKVGAVTDDTENLIQRAAGKYRVIIVSPTSFLAYLQTVMQGLRALQFEERTKEVIKWVEELRKHLGNYEIYVQKLGGHLGTSVNAYNTAYKELGKIDKDILKITGEAAGIKAAEIQGPEKDERL